MTIMSTKPFVVFILYDLNPFIFVISFHHLDFDHMMGDQGMHGSAQSPQMPMGSREPQKPGGGFPQMQGSVRGPPPPQDGRMGGAGPPGYVDDMSMEMGHMNVTSPPYNPNFPPDFYDGNM